MWLLVEVGVGAGEKSSVVAGVGISVGDGVGSPVGAVVGLSVGAGVRLLVSACCFPSDSKKAMTQLIYQMCTAHFCHQIHLFFQFIH